MQNNTNLKSESSHVRNACICTCSYMLTVSLFCKFLDVRFDKDLSTEDCVRNLDLFRCLCSQFICTSVLALKVEDLLYGSQAMKPNVIALLAEIFHKCEIESLASENGVEKQTSKSDVDLSYIVANKENVVDNAYKSSSAPVLGSEKFKSIEHQSPRESFKSERSSSTSGQINSSISDPMRQENSYGWKSQSDGQVNTNIHLSFKSPFHLDFTVDNDLQQPSLNGLLLKQGNEKENFLYKDKENPFSGILQRPVLAGDSRKHSLPANLAGGYGSPRTTSRQEVPLLMRRNKQKQRTLDLEEWDMQQEEVEGTVHVLYIFKTFCNKIIFLHDPQAGKTLWYHKISPEKFLVVVSLSNCPCIKN